MKKRPQVALVCAGNLSGSPILAFPGLPEQLGPVMSSSLRLASRIVHTLRAGSPVNNYEAFAESKLVLIAEPDAGIADTVRALADAGLHWEGKCVVLCSAALESERLGVLAECGAAIASLCNIPDLEVPAILVEGDRTAMAALRPLARQGAPLLMHVPASRKRFYLAAEACAGPLLAAILLRTDEYLQLAGVGAANAAHILRGRTGKTLRAFLKSGRGPQEPELERELAALAALDPDIADSLQRIAALTTQKTKRSQAMR